MGAYVVEPIVAEACLNQDYIDVGAQTLAKLAEEDGLPVPFAALDYKVELTAWRPYVAVPVVGRPDTRVSGKHALQS